MNENEICKAIVDRNPYPIVFVDANHVIQYLNQAAVYHYCTERGHDDLVGKSLFDCHFNPISQKKIVQVIDKFKKDAKEVYLHVNDKNLRVYITPVLSDFGEFLGYYERLEMNLYVQRPETAQQGGAPDADKRLP